MKHLSIIFLLIILSLPTQAQKIFLPIIPVTVEYEYAPQYLAQWFKHPNYSMIEATINPKDNNDLQIVLTETETYQRVFYTSSKTRAEFLKSRGKEVYLTKIDFKEIDQQPTFGFAFLDKTGQPIFWRVSYATEPSERGAGLTALPAVKGLKLNYRDSGTAVGEGTTVQIGNQVIEADLWKEISSPPYFVAYRGSVVIGQHSGNFLLETEKWTFTKQPTKLEKGEKWLLSDEKGRQRTLEITNIDKNEMILDEVSPILKDSSLIRLVIQNSPQGFALRTFSLKNQGQNMDIEFETPLPLTANESGDFVSEFTINQGDHKKVVSGKIVGVREKDSYTKLTWQFNSPDWTKKKALESMIKFSENGYSIETKEVGK